METNLVRADITKVTADAIVNAANSSLLGGGGVDGAIHKAGGKKILEDCLKIRERQGECPVGEAVYTNAGNLPAKYVIHTVGPIWRGGDSGEPEKLMNCYKNSMYIADSLQLSSIAFSNISTGIYGYPKEDAAMIAINAIQNFKAQFINKVIFVCFDTENFEIYNRILNAKK